MFLSKLISLYILYGIHCVLAIYPQGPGLVHYWGQHSFVEDQKRQQPLASYCDGVSEAVIIAFISGFNMQGDGLPLLNLADSCDGPVFEGTTLLNCPNVGKDIQQCQAKGIKVLLSLGGASGVYGFSSDAQGDAFATTLWNVFGGGSSPTRPFGSAIVDGFDLDIEGGSSTGYTALVHRLRQLFATDMSKPYFITAAPQCPFPDVILGPVINSIAFDALHIQFYNNYCSTTSGHFNFDIWDQWATTESPNTNISLYLTVPGSPTAATTGYVSLDVLAPIIKKVAATYSNFAGIGVWDASQSYANKQTLPSFAHGLQQMILQLKADGSIGNNNNNNNNNNNGLTSTTVSIIPSTPTGISAIPSSTTLGNEVTPSIPSDDECIKEGDSCALDARPICSEAHYGICNQGKYTFLPCPQGTQCFMTTDNNSIYCGTGLPGNRKQSQCTPRVRHNRLEHAIDLVMSLIDHATHLHDEDPSHRIHFRNHHRQHLQQKQQLAYSQQALQSSNLPTHPIDVKAVSTQISVTQSNGSNFTATVNTRRLDNRPFGPKVTMKFNVAQHIHVTGVENGQVQQDDTSVFLTVANPNSKSMSLVFDIFGTLDTDIFVAPDPNSLVLFSSSLR
ncbi:glycoside hydrolase superfamily [Halteromyces radiatus]|uniref:glycoside hydrolase superfamily n=1 Tax=Halteromyces radiatus TaxID=101107 RepID=UPI00221F2239|nr:glycoside hydrolase superfamily [Halteromyces radiatus]KAI8090004.1 glycoside hydrolase superfamily [Halteromyces radiatus]